LGIDESEEVRSLLGGLGAGASVLLLLLLDLLGFFADEAFAARGSTLLISSMLLTNVFKPGSPISSESSLSSKLEMTDLFAELIVILYKDIFLNCCSIFLYSI
jgi:hypothetical protein